MAKPIKRKKKSSKNTSMDSNMSMDSYSSSIDRDVELEHGTLEALKTQFKNAQNNNETSDPETLLRHNKELQTKNLELIKKLNKTTVERDNFEKLFLDWKKINKDASNALEYLQNEQMLLKKQNIKLTELNENMELKILKLSTELIDKNEMVEHLVHKTNKLNKQLNNFSDINNNLRKIVNENNKKNNKNKLLIENNKLKFEIENKNLILNNILSQFSTFYSVIKNHYPNYNFGQNNTLLKQAKSNPYGNGATKIDRKGKKKRKSWKLEDNKLIRDKILNGKFDDNIVDDIYNRSNSSDDDVALFKNGKTNTTVDDELRLMNAASDTSHKVQFVNIEAETKKNDDLSYNLGSFSMNGGPRQRSQSDGMFLRSSNKKSQSAHSIFKTKYEYKRTQLLFDQKIWSKRDSLKRKKKFQISAIPSSSNPNTPHVSVRGNNSDDDNIIQNNNNELNINDLNNETILGYLNDNIQSELLNNNNNNNNDNNIKIDTNDETKNSNASAVYDIFDGQQNDAINDEINIINDDHGNDSESIPVLFEDEDELVNSTPNNNKSRASVPDNNKPNVTYDNNKPIKKKDKKKRKKKKTGLKNKHKGSNMMG